MGGLSLEIFANGAQIIFDQFLSSSEQKWLRMSGLVVLLPHGYEGQGPEHSSARLERFLSLCATKNMQVCNCTTSAQYFHLMRRQILQKFRKPLIVMTPKSLLRSPLSSSSIKEILQEKFKKIIYDKSADSQKINTIVFCSGKIYYLLKKFKKEKKKDSYSIVRIEQL